MTKVSRLLVVDGDCYVIECAVRADGATSPAAAFLQQLSAGLWVEDPDLTGLPDDAQIDDYDKLLDWFHLLANEGVPPYRHAVNYLRDGIWEFKIGAKRLSFFDTPGDGTYVPKPPDDKAGAFDEDEFPWFPNFDEHIRLGHAFPKNAQRTSKEDLDKAQLVREEDVQHDKV